MTAAAASNSKQQNALIRIVQKAPTIALPVSPLPLHSTPPEQILEEEVATEEEEEGDEEEEEADEEITAATTTTAASAGEGLDLS